MRKNISELKLISFFLLVVFFSSFGCNSKEFRSIQAVEKGFRIDSVAAEKRAKQISPCIIISEDTIPPVISKQVVVHDTTKEYKDSLITLPCPDGTTVSTAVRVFTYTIHAITTVTKTFYIIKTVEDKGKNIIIRDLQKKVEKQKEKKDFWIVVAIISTLLFLLSIIILLLKKSLIK